MRPLAGPRLSRVESSQSGTERDVLQRVATREIDVTPGYASILSLHARLGRALRRRWVRGLLVTKIPVSTKGRCDLYGWRSTGATVA
jgi:hypothetical protein